MRSLLVLMYKRLCKHPLFLGQLFLLARFKGAYRRAGKKVDRDYVWKETQAPMAQDPPPAVDVPTAFFLRCALEGRHKTVIEVGAFGGERIIALKRLLPDVDCYGLDILPSYRVPFHQEGVQFHYFDETFFDSSKSDSLIVSNGTLCYVPLEELKRFLSLFSSRNISIAAIEPVPLHYVLYDTPHHPSTVQRSTTSYYHNYWWLFSEYGYHLPHNRHDGGVRSLSWTVQEVYNRFYGLPRRKDGGIRDEVQPRRSDPGSSEARL